MQETTKKRKRNDVSLVVSKDQHSNGNTRKKVKRTIKRTSNLQHPIVALEGHGSEIYSLKFNPKGTILASASFDKRIFLWNAFGENLHYGILKGHQNAVLEIDWSNQGDKIYSCSADKSAIIWDSDSGEKIRKARGHTQVVNAICRGNISNNLFLTGSDDGLVNIWDDRVKKSAAYLLSESSVTSVCLSHDDNTIYSAGVDEVVKVWDLRKKAVEYTLRGHTDTITCVRLSPDGNYLLSNSIDNTIRVWNVNSASKGKGRCLSGMTGLRHGIDKNLIRSNWSPDGRRICSGSSDTPSHVYIWDVKSRNIMYKLPGHRGTVNDVIYHPTEPVIASCGNDKTIYLGELLD